MAITSQAGPDAAPRRQTLESNYVDFLASANLSILDYLGLLNFENNENTREWYFKLKSRPSFRTILRDQIVGLNPDDKYKLIDI